MNQQMVAGFNPDQLAAQQMTRNRAMGGSAVNQAAQQQALNTMMGGGMMGAFNNQFNIPAQAMAQQFQQNVLPGIASQMGAAGRTGSGIHAQTLENAAGQYGGSLANLASQVYGQERGRQMQAMGMAPALAGQDYADIAALSGIGAQQQALQQAGMDAPYHRLAQMAGLLQGQGGGTTTTTSPTTGSPIGQAAGLGMMGYALGGPVGAGLGAAAGLFG
jgi:hypothetical protein